MADKSLEVKIVADVSSLQAQSAVAKAELATLNASVKSLATQFVAASDDMKGSLAPELDKAAVEAGKLRAEIAALNAEMKEAAAANAESSGAFGKVSAALTEATEKVEGLTAQFGAVGKLTAALSEFALAGLGVEQAAEAINSVAETGEKLEHLSEETGLTTEQLSGLRVIAQQTGTDFDEFSRLLAKLPGTLQEAVSNPSSRAGEALHAMGVQVTDLNTGQLLPMSDILDQVSAKLASYSDSANKTALETDIFGAKIGAELIPALNQLGTEGLQGAIDKSNELGQTWSGEDAKAADDFEKDLHTITLGIEGMAASIVRFALPALNDLAQGFALATGTADIDDRIQSLQGRIDELGVRASAGMKSDLAALEAQKAQIDGDLSRQSALAGGAAPGTAAAPNLKGGASIGAHQGAGDTDVADDGDNTDESGVTGGGGSGRVASARAMQDQITQIAQDAATARREIASSEYEGQVAVWNTEVAEGKISKEAEIQDEMSAQNQMYEAQLQELQQEAALDAQGTAQKAKALDDIAVLTAQHNAEIAKMNEELADQQIADAQKVQEQQQRAAQATARAWQQAFQPIETAFDSSINGVLQGTETLQNAELKAAQSIALAYIDAAGKKLISFVGSEAMILAQGIATQTGLTAAVTTGTATRTAVEASARETGKVAELASGTAEINNDAYRAAAGAFAAVAGIPYVGPVLAPAAAVAAYAGVMAFDVLSAAGGTVIPAGVNPLVQLHENEMVLPAYIAQPITSMLQNSHSISNSNSSVAGDTTIHLNQTVHGVGSDVAGMVRNANQAVMSQLIDLTRNGTLRLPGR